ncbi:hypothetical protein G6F36_014576 [Rhizopus arrhizus]|nr:hypothetical protein G6F36_014576 [Rhizopus arrhizus]
MSNLAIRLERLTSGHVLSQTTEGSSVLNQHIREEATDEELMVMMENCVTRVENATSALYLQRMGRFANVLEKLSEAIEADAMHIMKALQMYAELTTNKL